MDINELFKTHSYQSILAKARDEEKEKLQSLKMYSDYIDAIYSSMKHSADYLHSIDKDIEKLSRQSKMATLHPRIYDLTEYCLRNPEDGDAIEEMNDDLRYHLSRTTRADSEIDTLRQLKMAFKRNLSQIDTINSLVKKMEDVLGHPLNDSHTYQEILSDAIKDICHHTNKSLEDLLRLRQENKELFSGQDKPAFMYQDHMLYR